MYIFYTPCIIFTHKNGFIKIFEVSSAMMNYLKRLFSIILLAIYSANQNNILLNAGALTFYFILSLVPAFLILLTISNFIALSNSKLLFQILTSLSNLNEDVVLYLYKIIEQSSKADILSLGISGILSVILTSLLFSKSLNISFVNILNIRQKKIVGLLLPFFLNISGLAVLIFALVLKFSLIFVHNFFFNFLNIDLTKFITLSQKLLLAPVLIFFVSVFLSYYILSGKKLKFWLSFTISLLFTFTVFALNKIYFSFIDINIYKMLYGQIGLLIFSLYWLYVIFIFYLFYLQLGACILNYKIFVIRFWLKKGQYFGKILSKIFPENFSDSFIFLEDINDVKKLEGKKFFIMEGYLKLKKDNKILIRQAGDIFKLKDESVIDVANLQLIEIQD